MAAIPEPVYIGDALKGSLVNTVDGLTLALGPLPDDFPAGQVSRTAGGLIVRYGWEYLQQEDAIVPGLVVTEYGEMWTGREGWDFARAHSNMHPRAEVLGLRITDGQTDQVRFRDLDFGREIVVAVYESEAARQPVAQVVGYWIANESVEVPEILAEVLPRVAVLKFAS